MVHGILQFTPSIAFRYVLHRCKSLDIRCRESLCIMCQGTTAGAPSPGRRGALIEFLFLGAFSAGVCVREGGERNARPSYPKGGRGAEHPEPSPCIQTDSRVGLHVRHRQ
jgi:hypothetical protein